MSEPEELFDYADAQHGIARGIELDEEGSSDRQNFGGKGDNEDGDDDEEDDDDSSISPFAKALPFLMVAGSLQSVWLASAQTFSELTIELQLGIAAGVTSIAVWATRPRATTVVAAVIAAGYMLLCSGFPLAIPHKTEIFKELTVQASGRAGAISGRYFPTERYHNGVLIYDLEEVDVHGPTATRLQLYWHIEQSSGTTGIGSPAGLFDGVFWGNLSCYWRFGRFDDSGATSTPRGGASTTVLAGLTGVEAQIGPSCWRLSIQQLAMTQVVSCHDRVPRIMCLHALCVFSPGSCFLRARRGLILASVVI